MEPLSIQRPDVLAPAGEVGPYRLLRSLGRGGMAEVFLAVHRYMGHVRAIKVLLPGISSGRSLAMRLITEARAMARLRHPAIVEVFECDTLPRDSAFIVMEYLEGEPAGDWLGRAGRLATRPQLAAALIGAVADALAYAHKQGIIHRDIKPDNLFLVPDGGERRHFRVKILDFGIAKLLGEKPLITTRMGSVVGTPYYMPPEGWENGATIDQRTDIYSLGCVFFEMLAGRPPFQADDAYQMMRAHFLHKAPLITTLAPEVPLDLERLIAKMLNKDPDERPGSMEEVVVALESYLERKRDRFGELLEAPEELRIASERAPQAASKSLAQVWPVEHTTPSMVGQLGNTQRVRRFSPRELRMMVAGGLAFLLVAGASIGTAMVRQRNRPAAPRAASVVAPAPRPPAPPPRAPAPPAPAPVVQPPPAPPPVVAEPAPPAATPTRLRARRTPTANPPVPATPATPAAPPATPAAPSSRQPLNEYQPVED